MTARKVTPIQKLRFMTSSSPMSVGPFLAADQSLDGSCQILDCEAVSEHGCGLHLQPARREYTQSGSGENRILLVSRGVSRLTFRAMRRQSVTSWAVAAIVVLF